MIYFYDNYKNLSLNCAEDVLPENRFQKFNRLKIKRDKENCLASYLLLKLALKEHGIEDFQLEYSENGKPMLKTNRLHFNISHCKLGIAIAVSESPVGIDIQEITPCNAKVMKRAYTNEEQVFIKNSYDKDKAFTTIWTLKECAVKCDGKTISNLKDFSFENTTDRFTKYGKSFVTCTENNLIISACGSERFDKRIKNVEDLK